MSNELRASAQLFRLETSFQLHEAALFTLSLAAERALSAGTLRAEEVATLLARARRECNVGQLRQVINWVLESTRAQQVISAQ